MKKIPVAILGATGNVGQRFVQLLDFHPWFEVQAVCASEKNIGKKYKDAVNWHLATPIPEAVKNQKIGKCEGNITPKIVFSALDSSVAGPIEEEFAKAGYAVISNSKNHRMDLDVPLLIPEVNPGHLQLIAGQKKRWGSSGFIVTNPNCTTIGLTIVLKAIDDKFGVKRVVVNTMQALSGAGWPGVASLDALDNVLPYIEGEEEKVETETLKLLGRLKEGRIVNAKISISAHCSRVNVRDGHTETLTLDLAKKAKLDEVKNALINFSSLPQKLRLPSAPIKPITYKDEVDRPQPLLDRDLEKGMTVSAGRVRKSNVFDINLVLVVHNTIRGAAGAAILNAELLKVKGFI